MDVLNCLTVTELKTRARELKISNYWKLKKSELVIAIDNYVYPLLYVYAKKNVEDVPINDNTTLELEKILEACTDSGTYGNGIFTRGEQFLGVHQCICGTQSKSCDYLLTPHFATNTLCVHYLRYHRGEVPKNELFKVNQMFDEYKKQTVV